VGTQLGSHKIEVAGPVQQFGFVAHPLADRLGQLMLTHTGELKLFKRGQIAAHVLDYDHLKSDLTPGPAQVSVALSGPAKAY
jgi:hypothetical protein